MPGNRGSKSLTTSTLPLSTNQPEITEPAVAPRIGAAFSNPSAIIGDPITGLVLPRATVGLIHPSIEKPRRRVPKSSAGLRGTTMRVASPSPKNAWFTSPVDVLKDTLPKRFPSSPLTISAAPLSIGHQPTMPARYGAWFTRKLRLYEVELVVGRLLEIAPSPKTSTLLLSQGAGSSG